MLANHSEKVVSNGSMPNWKEISSAVLQAPGLGPQLFSMNCISSLNYSEDGFEYTVSKSADDTMPNRMISTSKDWIVDHDKL